MYIKYIHVVLIYIKKAQTENITHSMCWLVLGKKECHLKKQNIPLGPKTSLEITFYN